MAAEETIRVLTVPEAARLLRCSKAHVHHLISGKVPGVVPLPSLWLGRRRLILKASFEQWLLTSERNPEKEVGHVQPVAS